MNNGMNKVLLVGIIGEQPQLKEFDASDLLRLRLSTSTTYRDRSDEVQEATQWHTVVLWGERANSTAAVVNKGDKVFVEGELRTRSYEKEGVRHYTTEIKARDVQLLHSPGDSPVVATRPLASASAPADEPKRSPARRSGPRSGRTQNGIGSRRNMRRAANA